MSRLRRSMGVAAFAATLFLVGGVGAWRSYQDAPVAAATTGADALVAPVAGASLEQTIADLQTHLQSQPDDPRSLALLGLAYAQEATHTADPSYYPKAEEALQRSLALQPDGNVEALVGMGVVALARHDFAGGVRWGHDEFADAAHHPRARVVQGTVVAMLRLPGRGILRASADRLGRERRREPRPALVLPHVHGLRPRAGRTEQRHALSWFDSERNVLQHRFFAFVIGKAHVVENQFAAQLARLVRAFDDGFTILFDHFRHPAKGD